MTVFEPVQSAIPQTVEEVIPFEFYVTLDGSSSGAVATHVESTYLHLENSFISKTPLMANTIEATKVTSVPVGSPQNQENGAFVFDDLESTLFTKTNTTTSGENSDDPIKLGYALRYGELMNRMSSIENTIGEMKDLMKQMLEVSKCQHSTQQIS
ncbi:hypothetical protein HanOQP8_Chr06g0223601 [Helianthus annuus]|nr:hypothetical protein HanOQP8_Chr06g0223601 [Helianthus annuus]